jgi:hypothetical protein
MSPLKKGSSKKVISENIEKEMKTGKSNNQSIAISLDKARKSKKGKPSKNVKKKK